MRADEKADTNFRNFLNSGFSEAGSKISGQR
jgi:hypothetical protein